MAKSLPAKRTINNPEKGKRYETIGELRAAVRAACVAEVDQRFAEERAGDGNVPENAGERMEAYVKKAIPSSLDARPRQAWRDLAAALVAAAEVVKQSIAAGAVAAEDRPESNEFTDRIELLFANATCNDERIENGFSMFEFVDSLPAQIADERATRAEASMRLRSRLVEHFDVPDRGWWASRAPSNRDLAILSLLAGEFPPKSKQQQEEREKRVATAEKGSKKPPPASPTVAMVLEEETRIITTARARAASTPHT